DRRLLESLFSGESIETKHNTEAVDVGANRLASARIVEYHAQRLRPFDEVKDDVRKLVVAEEAHQRAVKSGQARLAELGKGDGAKVEGFGAPQTVRRSAP